MEKYRGRAFDWADKATCLHLARTQLRYMGHKPPAIPAFRSAIGAKRAMEAAGYQTMADIFDGLGLERITPAAMMVGDLAVLPGDGGFDAIVICAGNKMIGWHEGSDTLTAIGDTVQHIIGAWRL